MHKMNLNQYKNIGDEVCFFLDRNCDKPLTLEQIAAHCGYFDTSCFIKNFKELVGTTPKKYRSGLYAKNETEDT